MVEENPLDDDAARANIIATSMVAGTWFIVAMVVNDIYQLRASGMFAVEHFARRVRGGGKPLPQYYSYVDCLRDSVLFSKNIFCLHITTTAGGCKREMHGRW